MGEWYIKKHIKKLLVFIVIIINVVSVNAQSKDEINLQIVGKYNSSTETWTITKGNISIFNHGMFFDIEGKHLKVILEGKNEKFKTTDLWKCGKCECAVYSGSKKYMGKFMVSMQEGVLLVTLGFYGNVSMYAVQELD